MNYIVAICTVLLLCTPIHGALADTAPLESLPQLELVPGITPEDADLNRGINGLFNSAVELVRIHANASWVLGIKLLGICLALSLLISFSRAGNTALPERAAEDFGIGAIALLSLQESGGVLQACADAIGELVQFANLLFPVYVGAATVSGHPVSAAAQAGATMLAANLIMRFARGLFLPAVKGYILLSAAALLGDNGLLRKIAAMIRSGAVLAMRILLMAFTAYLALSGIISGGADVTAVKAARMALTSTVPVVGAIIADASDALLSGASVLKNSIGVFGCIAACAVCLTPFVRCFLHLSAFRILAALAGSFSGVRCGTMLQAVGDAFSFALGLLGTGCALQFLSFVVSSVVA